MARLKIELNTADIKRLVAEELAKRLGDVEFDATEVKIKVKSVQNYRVNEWESGDFKAEYEADI